MKMNLKYILFALLPLTGAACSSVDVDDVNTQTNLPNRVYMDGVLTSPLKKVTVDGAGSAVTFSARTANLVTKDLDVLYSIDTLALKQYNAIYGKNYKVLPDDCYTIERTKDVIKAGGFTTAPVHITINEKALAVNPSYKYAIPVAVESCGGLETLKNNSYQIFALDRVLETSAVRQTGFCMRYDFPNAPVKMKEWSLHYGMKFLSLFDNQQPVCGPFYSRITRDGKLQYKAGGSDDPLAFSIQRLKPNTWYHVTYTYKNQHVKMYINGVLEREFDVTNNDDWYKVQVSWGNFNGWMRDIRVYDYALSADQVADNLYVEDPTNPHLVVYAPLSKETGLKCVVSRYKDDEGNSINFHAYVSNKPDAYPESNIKWDEHLRFPEK